MGIFSKNKKVEEPAVQPTTSLPKAGNPAAYRIVIGPHVTEKATNGAAHGAYVFRVSAHANKTAIKYAIEKLYKVHVRKVHVLHVPAKKRQVGRYEGVKSGFKKAVVTLRPGDTIDTTG